MGQPAARVGDSDQPRLAAGPRAGLPDRAHRRQAGVAGGRRHARVPALRRAQASRRRHGRRRQRHRLRSAASPRPGRATRSSRPDRPERRRRRRPDRPDRLAMDLDATADASSSGTGWAFPVAARPGHRRWSSWSRYEEDIRQSIHIILGTAKGERVMRPDFGCGIHDLVFAALSHPAHRPDRDDRARGAAHLRGAHRRPRGDRAHRGT